MKKLLALVLSVVMVMSLAACGSKGSSNGSQSEITDSPVEVLTKVWETYGEDEKFFAMGGDYSNIVDNAPGAFDISDAEGLDAMLGYPQASVAMIDSAASLLHAMNANTFTAGAYNVTETDEIAMLISDIEENISSRQWICGFPDTLVVIQVGKNVVVTAFGEAGIIENFKTKVLEVYEGAEVSVEKSLVE